jgi:type I restriction enzyme R subunit
VTGGEIRGRDRKNVIQNRVIELVQVIEKLIGLAKDMRAMSARSEGLGLSGEELAFHDALAVNNSAVQVLGEPTLQEQADVLSHTWAAA